MCLSIAGAGATTFAEAVRVLPAGACWQRARDHHHRTKKVCITALTAGSACQYYPRHHCRPWSAPEPTATTSCTPPCTKLPPAVVQSTRPPARLAGLLTVQAPQGPRLSWVCGTHRPLVVRAVQACVAVATAAGEMADLDPASEALIRQLHRELNGLTRTSRRANNNQDTSSLMSLDSLTRRRDGKAEPGPALRSGSRLEQPRSGSGRASPYASTKRRRQRDHRDAGSGSEEGSEEYSRGSSATSSGSGRSLGDTQTGPPDAKRQRGVWGGRWGAGRRERVPGGEGEEPKAGQGQTSYMTAWAMRSAHALHAQRSVWLHDAYLEEPLMAVPCIRRPPQLPHQLHACMWRCACRVHRLHGPLPGMQCMEALHARASGLFQVLQRTAGRQAALPCVAAHAGHAAGHKDERGGARAVGGGKEGRRSADIDDRDHHHHHQRHHHNSDQHNKHHAGRKGDEGHVPRHPKPQVWHSTACDCTSSSTSTCPHDERHGTPAAMHAPMMSRMHAQRMRHGGLLAWPKPCAMRRTHLLGC